MLQHGAVWDATDAASRAASLASQVTSEWTQRHCDDTAPRPYRDATASFVQYKTDSRAL